MIDKLLGKAAVEPITAVGNILDNLFTSDEERLDKEIVKQRLLQNMALVQVELNKVEASHRSVFVAGWRPFIGWVCGLSLASYFLPKFILASYLWVKMCLEANELLAYPVDSAGLFELVLAMLGMGGWRSLDKWAGKAK